MKVGGYRKEENGGKREEGKDFEGRNEGRKGMILLEERALEEVRKGGVVGGRLVKTGQRRSGHACHSRKLLVAGERAGAQHGYTHEGHEGSWGIEGAEVRTGEVGAKVVACGRRCFHGGCGGGGKGAYRRLWVGGFFFTAFVGLWHGEWWW